MKEFISEKNFVLAEKTAKERDIHIFKAASEYFEDSGEIRIADARKVMELVRPRPENSHKGSFGRLVIIAGSERYPGAPQLCALAALRCGVGLCAVVTTSTPASALAVNAKEATLLKVSHDEKGFMSPTPGEHDDLSELLASADAVLIGPGLGKGAGCLKILEYTLETANCPIIIDADGINLVCGRIEFLRKAKAEPILTPHPAELARLCGAPLSEILENRAAYAKLAREKTGGVIVAKSAGTLIASRGGLALSMRGNSGLAKGGSGDLLAGIIASFAAQGYPWEEAALIGATVQGLACELATQRLSRRSTLAGDVIAALPLLFQKSERHDLFEKDSYGSLRFSGNSDGLHEAASIDG